MLHNGHTGFPVVVDLASWGRQGSSLCFDDTHVVCPLRSSISRRLFGHVSTAHRFFEPYPSYSLMRIPQEPGMYETDVQAARCSRAPLATVA